MDTEPEPQPFDDGVSPAQRWFVDNLLTEGEAETDSRAKVHHLTIKASSIAWMTVNNGFRLCVTRDRPCDQNIARRFKIRTTHYGHRFLLSALRLYRSGVTVGAKWFILERNEALFN